MVLPDCLQRVSAVYRVDVSPAVAFRARRRSQPCAAACCFWRAIAMATSSASRRSSRRVSFRDRSKPRIRSRADLYSSSSLACSGQEIARAEGEHMEHLLKTPRAKVAEGRRKSKYYFRLYFAL